MSHSLTFRATLAGLWMAVTVMSAPAIAQTATASATDNAYVRALPAWADLLRKHVDDQGRIDFVGVQAESTQLAEFIAAIAQVSPQTHPELFPERSQVLAYHINAYNALALQGVLDRDIPKGFTSFFKRASFFRLRGMIMGGETTNLYTYENQVIRPLDEPRTHFALNCMVKDCPRLPQEPFLAETLDTQLEAATKEFFGSTKYLRVDKDAKRAEVSSILKFYTKDFVPSGKTQQLHGYINRYAPVAIPDDYRIRFIKYDWRLNAQP